MTLTEEEITRLFLVNRTLMQMLKDRGYFIDDSEITITLEDFINKYSEKINRNDLCTLKAMKNDNNDRIFIFFPDALKIGVAEMKDYTNRMKSENVYRAILVVQKAENLSRFAKTSINTIFPKFHVEVFQESELLVNVNENFFVPEHKALTNEEKNILLEKYTVQENQLPRIHVTDPIAKYYGLVRGQVVKIKRPSETAGFYVTYRYVV